MIVADSDVLIDFLRGSGATAARVESELRRGGLCTTAVNRFELLSGAKGVRQHAVILDLLAALETLPLDHAAADRAASFRRELERAGEPIGMADSLIAGIVAIQNGVLLTRNVKHYRRIKALSLLDISRPADPH